MPPSLTLVSLQYSVFVGDARLLAVTTQLLLQDDEGHVSHPDTAPPGKEEVEGRGRPMLELVLSGTISDV